MFPLVLNHSHVLRFPYISSSAATGVNYWPSVERDQRALLRYKSMMDETLSIRCDVPFWNRLSAGAC